MNEVLIRDIEGNYQPRTTDELLAIWHAEKREEYSDEAFEAIRRILGSRGHTLPPKVAGSEIDRAVQNYPSGPRNKDYVCTECHVAFAPDRPLPHSFLGFTTFNCPKCTKTNSYPLTRGYRTAYWFIVVAMLVLCIALLRQGIIVLPGFVWIAAVAALVNNGILKRNVRKAWYEHERQGKPTIQVPPMSDAERAASGDPIRWFHVVFAIVLPYIAIPWGIVNLIRRKRRSGLLLLVVPIIVFAVVIAISVIATRGK